MISSNRTIIGWKETVDLPDWGVRNLIAKSDTGARRSAIDVKNIEELPDNRVRFEIVLDRRDRSKTRVIVSPISHVTHVRSSNGLQHERYFVVTRVKVGGVIKDIELSLVCRKSMICRMLLGRKALEDDFLVDPKLKYATGPRLKVKTERRKKRRKQKV